MSIINGAGLNSFRSQFTAGTTYALAEIIDNSIQWKQKGTVSEINIVLIESQPGWHMREVFIIDNGVGMDEETIQTCLDFGGGKNHGTTENGKLGKFGLGLPYSSCSQSPNYHVYSWQQKGEYLHNYRNHKDYGPGDPVESNEVTKSTSLPSKIIEAFNEVNSYESGTVVHWNDCDKLDVVKAQTLIKHIEQNLGRIYRHQIDKGDVKINFVVFRDFVDKLQKTTDLCRPIRVFDPMFLKTNTCLPGDFSRIATNEVWGGINGSGEDTIQFIEERAGSQIEHTFKIRYSLATPATQALGGKSDLGKEYGKAVGISLVRANRELKIDTFGFKAGNADDNRNRWWSIEFLFEPISDDLLGVNANKLDAKNFRYLDSEDSIAMEADGELENSARLRKEFSIRIQRSIDDMFKIIVERAKGATSKQVCPKCNQKTFTKGKCTSCDYTSNNCPIHNIELDKDGICQTCKSIRPIDMCVIHRIPLEKDGNCPKCPKIKKVLTKDEKKEIENIFNNYPEFAGKREAIERTINWFLQSNRNHFIVLTDLKNPATFIQHHNFQDKFTIIEVNNTHPFYDHFMNKIIEEDNEDAVAPLLLFIASWINSELDDYSNAKILERFRGKFGYNLMDIIANWTQQ